MVRAHQGSSRLVLLSLLTVLAGIVSLLLGGSAHDLLLVAGAALVTVLCMSLTSSFRAAGADAGAQRPASNAVPKLRAPPGRRATPLLAATVEHPSSAIDDAVGAFQRECLELLLDAEAARVQTESCEGGVRAVDQASRSLAATCDVLGRRAGLTQSHALMARCATSDAAECLRHAIDCTDTWRQSIEDAATGEHATGAAGSQRLGEVAMDSLARAGDALGAALERGDEAARLAAELGGAAARGQRHALNLSEACAGLAPSLDESARTGLRLAMLAASLDENAGRVTRMLSAAAGGQRWPQPPSGAATNWRGGVTGDCRSVTEETGNVVYVRFQRARGKPGAEQA